MASNVAKQLQADLVELELLAKTAQRPNVQSTLSKAAKDLKLQIDQAISKETELSSDKSASPDGHTASAPREFITISSFAWDQKNNMVNIYINLAGVHKIPRENITSDFDNNSFDVKVIDCGKKNYRFNVNQTFGNIKPTGCSCRVKVDSLVIKLEKTDLKTWDMLEIKEAKKKSKKDDMEDLNPNDPTGNLMGMMRKLYQEGDDDMKKIIAKTWSEAQENRKSGM